MDPEAVWGALMREWQSGEITRGVYGFGFVHPGRVRQGTESAARYLGRNAASYLAGQEGKTRHYVSSRITKQTGVTMQALRSVNYMYVRRMLGESPIPEWWNEDKAAAVLRVWGLVEAARGP
jgi:hypothetical protein